MYNLTNKNIITLTLKWTTLPCIHPVWKACVMQSANIIFSTSYEHARPFQSCNYTYFHIHVGPLQRWQGPPTFLIAFGEINSKHMLWWSCARTISIEAINGERRKRYIKLDIADKVSSMSMSDT